MEKKREETIKDTYEQCGSTKEPMVLQHMWHLPSYKQHIRNIYKISYNKDKNNRNMPEVMNEEVQSLLDEFTELKEACPSCVNRI